MLDRILTIVVFGGLLFVLVAFVYSGTQPRTIYYCEPGEVMIEGFDNYGVSRLCVNGRYASIAIGS